MSEIMEELYREGVAEGTAKADHDSRVEMALLMLQDGFEFQSVAKYSGLSVEEIEELAQGKSA